MDSKSSKDSLDVSSALCTLRRIHELLLPLHTAKEGLLFLARWENYFLSLSVVLVLSFLLYNLVLLFFVLASVGAFVMATGYYYRHSRLESARQFRQLPSVAVLENDHNVLAQLQVDGEHRRISLLEYQRLLVTVDASFESFCEALETAYSVVLWKSHSSSVCVSVVLVCFLVLLLAVPLSHLLSSLPPLAFCTNRCFLDRSIEVFASGLERVSRIWNFWRRKSKAIRVRLSPPSPSEEPYMDARQSRSTRPMESTLECPATDLHSGSPMDSNNPVPPAELGQGDPSTGAAAPEGSATSTGPQQEINRDTVTVSYSTADQAVRGHGTSANKRDTKGSCEMCNASFAKLLKRKHDCNYCGHTFCGSCTVKVKRAMLGATSPAAYEESVRVCLQCREMLSIIQSSPKSSPPPQ